MESKDFNLSAEDKFILLCSKTQMNEWQIQLATRMAEDKLDWEYLFQKAHENGVAPLIYQNLKKINNLVPPNIIKDFKLAYIASRFHNELRYEDLREVLAAFNKEKIPVFLYKGAVLGEMIYKDIAFRPMLDFDLLVRQQDWPKILRILSQLDFFSVHKFSAPYTDLAQKIGLPVPLDYQLNYINKNNTRLEFKFCLFWLDFPKFETEIIWKNAEKASLREANIYIPSPEEHLLLVCIGSFKHNYNSLIWFCDISELIRHYAKELNWEKLIRKSKKKRVSVLLYYSLLFTERLLDIKIPKGLLDDLTPNYIRRRIFESLYGVEEILTFRNNVDPSGSALSKLLLINKFTLNLKFLPRFISYFLKYIFVKDNSTFYYYSIPKGTPKPYLFYLKRFWKFLKFGFRVFKKAFCKK